MISNQAIKKCLLHLGYRNADVHADYRFAAVETSTREIRSVQMAAFLDGPASYKTAALAVVQSADSNVIEQVAARRSLGAPYLIVLNKERASAWTYGADGPKKIDETPIADWESLLNKQQGLFSANAIRQLKLVRVRSEPTNLSLFDSATLRAIQADTQSAVYELLEDFLNCFPETTSAKLSLERDYRLLFPMTFRLLAAKILIDREDKRLGKVDVTDIQATLAVIEDLYTLTPLDIRWNTARIAQVSHAWNALRDGLYVRNIAADDLAFVYEHALITPDIRQRYGTHSTPSSVADYVVRSFNLPTDERAQDLVVFEPFAGSCVFLTAALRRLKELLPPEWTPKQTHGHLVSHFKASEIDSFACEIARLALILADYPNHNGWRISNENLFEESVLYDRAKTANIVMCNPPFEDFDETQTNYSIHKPLAALELILSAQPDYLGIVMPDGLSTHQKYTKVLAEITDAYTDVEVLKLPEGVFRHALVGAEVLIAQHPRSKYPDLLRTRLQKTEVRRIDLPQFEHSLRPTSREEIEIDPITAPGLIGLRPLRDLWEELNTYPRLGSVADIHRGLEWNYEQASASRSTKATGFQMGVHRFSDGGFAQFRILDTTFLDCRPSKQRGGAINLPWEQPKIICNSARSSRGPWRLAAAVDTDGLVASQQFFGIWLKPDAPDTLDLWALAAILNSPIANAHSFCHDSEKRFRVSVMKTIPLPQDTIPSSIRDLIVEYQKNANDSEIGPLFGNKERNVSDILMAIDAHVLAAYDLPPRLEKELLRFMKDEGRPCQHSFPAYPGVNSATGALPLHARLSLHKKTRTIAWENLSTPLPSDLADVFALI